MSSSSRRNWWYWISAWCPVVIAIGVIVIESTEWFGADHTTGPLRWLYESLFGRVSNTLWEVIHHYIRKSGHFTGYGLMGLTWLRAWWITLPRSNFLPDSILAVVGTALVASCDEWHQTFLANRTGSPWDVLLDCTGAITLQLIVYIIMRTFKPKKLARAA